MAMLEVIRVELADGEKSPESITHLSGKGWRAPVDVIVAEIEKGKNAYYLVCNGRNFLVSVTVGPRGKYLRTRTDGCWSDLLLSLADCDAAPKPA